MLTIRSVKELVTLCKGFVNFKEATMPNHPIHQWIERCLNVKNLEQDQLKLELYEILLSLKKNNIEQNIKRDGFIDRNTGEVLNDIFDNPALPIIFEDKNFWFTGRCFYASRSKCEEAVRVRGGKSFKNKNPDYLVVGLFSEILFYGEHYSSKIGRALWLKTDRFVKNEFPVIRISADETVSSRTERFVKGSHVSIISEEHWMK